MQNFNDTDSNPYIWFLLQLWAFITFKPVFTKSQLKALTAGDEFQNIDYLKFLKLKILN